MANPTTSVFLMTGTLLGAGNTASLILMLSGGKLVLDFDLNCSGGPTTVTFSLQFSQDGATWFDEVAEEDAGKGVVSMPKVIRTLADNNSTSIANNANFRAHCEFVRDAQFARVLMAVSAGACTVNSLTSPYGSLVTAGS